MMEAVRTSETSVDNHFTRHYIPEDNSEHHTRRRENLKSHKTVQGNEETDSGTKKSLYKELLILERMENNMLRWSGQGR
jgi:hypothetical protein